MITIDCHEFTLDEQLALATAISDGLRGKALALIQDSKIVIDPIGKDRTELDEVKTLTRFFLSRRKDAQHNSVERDGNFLLTHSPDPPARTRGRKRTQLPGNLLQCPFCGFITSNQGPYDIHVRSHGITSGF
jgi:hypothetical protein